MTKFLIGASCMAFACSLALNWVFISLCMAFACSLALNWVFISGKASRAPVQEASCYDAISCEADKFYAEMRK